MGETKDTKCLSRFRIRQIKQADKPLFVIDEIVSSQGYYITWPDFYGSDKAAQAEIDKINISY